MHQITLSEELQDGNTVVKAQWEQWRCTGKNKFEAIGQLVAAFPVAFGFKITEEDTNASPKV